MKKKKDILCEVDRLEMEGYSEEESIQKIFQKRMDIIKRNGFIIDVVIPEEDKTFFNCHTHGLITSRNHIELQILILFIKDIVTTKQIAMDIIWTFVNRIDKGEIFKDGDIVSIQEDYKVKMYKININNENYLRILMPDQKGYFPDEKKCEDFFKLQLIE